MDQLIILNKKKRYQKVAGVSINIQSLIMSDYIENTITINRNVNTRK